MKEKGAVRVWVVEDRTERGWTTLLGTIARTRSGSIARYSEGHPTDWVTGGTYAIDQKNGWVRCVTATLTTDAKSKPKPKRRAKS